ncbi:BTAD domain-containing putative transcriptional regulator [Bradyrhizobium septentrionale]|uniref:Transcriptional regulator n=3 Tax=Bradyrhizobium septentrionale TaxID=1404411 RepID=A0A974A0T1_9BRAD|nr:BTAD domain-containing putative transcriptional regulator [Bradyrhizobium septentrionale]UGY14364.1 transcriptional regulator [Bradyrhizobium septentrionale]UGY22928.1 transcriptional regulator [Bradyrhizobium septentrionale]
MEMASLFADRLLLLGPLQVIHNGSPVAQPPSRKVRALLAYLAMAARPVSREKLCEFLWDVADDPRGELRWCLSKLRPLVDGPTTMRLVADRKQVCIETSALDIDALLVARRTQKTLTCGSPSDLRALLNLFRGDFLEGLSVERAPSFENWLAGQRHRFGQLRQQLLERLSSLLPPESEDRIEVLRECLDIAPFDEAVHIELVRALLGRGLYAEAEHQIDASVTRFQTEGIDPSSLKAAFATAQQSISKPISVSLVGVAHSGIPPARPRHDTRGPTLLLLPFTAAPGDVADADSVTSDIIFGIAKLRSISVIARGTALSLRNQTPAAAATLVNAQYVASGHLRRDGKKYLVTVELIDPRSDRIFWVDEFSCNTVDSFSVPPLLAARIITGLDAEIHVIERNRALLMPPASLDAWQAYHRGLACMYRFTTDSNREAQHFFKRAITLDPTFSRSHAGLSFTHFQNAFHLHVSQPEREISLAFETAEQALMSDPNDPAAHCAIGRALWLQHAHDGALGELNQSVRLSPNYAFAHYTLAFVQAQTGDPARAIDAADIASHLSPLDPMMFGTHRVRTFALLRLGKIEEAADFAKLVGEHAGDHVHAHAVSALTLAAAGRVEEAQAARRRISALRPDYNFKLFKEALHMLDDLTGIYQKAAKLLQIPEC